MAGTDGAAGPLAGMALGPVVLRVADLARALPWYRAVLGLVPLADAPGRAALGPAGGPPLVVLVERPGAASPPAGATGLYHLALLLPGRADLGRWLAHALATGVELDGAADHGVSEAFYLRDPDGNGIEVTADRPRAAWPRRPDGGLAIGNARIDSPGLLAAGQGAWAGAPAGTAMGHVHLRVADLDRADAWWVGRLGLTPVQRAGGALFVAADGYHHHLGLNVWHSAGGAPAPAGRTGLVAFTILLPRPPPPLAADPEIPWLRLLSGPIEPAAALGLG